MLMMLAPLAGIISISGAPFLLLAPATCASWLVVVRRTVQAGSVASWRAPVHLRLRQQVSKVGYAELTPACGAEVGAEDAGHGCRQSRRILCGEGA